MSKRENELLLEDMLQSCEKIFLYVDGMDFNSFSLDNKTIDAVIRNFEIIGEAANRLTEDFKEAHPQIEWFRLRGLRNRIVHHYFGIDNSIVWGIIEDYLPKLKSELSNIIKKR